MKFTKMQGLGNDYVYINCIKSCPDNLLENIPKVARFVSDRHFGIGSDGLVLIMPSDVADFRMRMFNSDGSEAEMCGNAIRCVGKYVYDNGFTAKTTVSIETLAGIKVLSLVPEHNRIVSVRVDMGEPVLNPADIPVIHGGNRFISQPLEIDGRLYKVTCVSMGNPHAVTYVDDVDNFPVKEVGPKMENHNPFPKRINAEFVQVIDEKTLKMRVWERGAGETMACGTGASAVLVASVLNGLSERKATVKLAGGDLIIEWSESDNHVYMTGPAVKVFEGEIDLDEVIGQSGR